MNDSLAVIFDAIRHEFGDVAEPVRLVRIFLRLTIAAAIGGILRISAKTLGNPQECGRICSSLSAAPSSLGCPF